jgi:hypothetical protein
MASPPMAKPAAGLQPRKGHEAAPSRGRPIHVHARMYITLVILFNTNK